MKYIITESRFESIVFNYLDSRLEGTEPMKGKYSDIVFGVPGETMGLIGIENPDWYSTLYIDSELLKGITLMFSLEWENTFDIIKKYVESRYNLKINSVLFGDEQRIIK